MTGRRTQLCGLVLAGLALGGCGSGAQFADQPRPAPPVNVSVYVNDQRISVSPNSVGPGYVTITITNQSSGAQAIQVASAGGSAITTTGPLSPQATDQVTVRLASGDYTVGTSPNSSAQAAAAAPTGIAAGALTVQGQRSNSNNQVLQP